MPHVLPRTSPQDPAVGSAPGPGREQRAGGFAWAVDDWARLRRFLILGSQGGSYYAREWKLTRENAEAVERCLAADGARTVATIVEISEAGRAPKNDPAVFALAMAAGAADEATRRAALAALPRVCRTARTCSSSSTFVEGFRGWGRGAARAVGGWYAARSVESLAYQAVKYREREGVTHRDVLRLAHPAGRVSAGNPTLELSATSTDACSSGSSAAARPRACRALVEGFALRAGGGDCRPRRRGSCASTACRARRSRAST